MSLFGSDEESEPDPIGIEGLYHFSDLIPHSVLDAQLSLISSSALLSLESNQSMLWGSQARTIAAPLLDVLPALVRPLLPSAVYAMLFESDLTLQVIINLYSPKEGIIPHVDLPNRYADGILGVSFLSSAMLEFSKEDQVVYSALLKPGDVYVLSGEARYGYNHAIPEREMDVYVEHGVKRTLVRGNRMSITFRRMLPGADLVGG